jgi:hypothetical protein
LFVPFSNIREAIAAPLYELAGIKWC